MGVNCNGVDLTYALNETSIFWPGGEKFKLCMECSVDQGYHYAAGVFSCAEHGGTHVDAPFHFAADGLTVDLIPICDLIGPCRVIDISRQCTEDKNYTLSEDDILNYEIEHGLIEERSIVLVRTGWSRYWSQGAKHYLGFDESTDGPYDPTTSELSFPGIGIQAAEYLVLREIAAVGLDTGKVFGNIYSYSYVIVESNPFSRISLLVPFYYLY